MNVKKNEIQSKVISVGQMTPSTVAGMLGIGQHTVLKLIGCGELKATNLGTGETPRWKIDEADVVAFLAGRCNQVPRIICDRSEKTVNRNSSSRIVGGIR